MTEENKRKNFSTKVIEEVFEEQGRCCGKCGNSLLNGYHAHHKNGKPEDNSKENCQLLCRGCHGGEQYQTLQAKKKLVIEDIDSLVETGINGKASGATLDKLLDAIKLKLSLLRQVHEDDILQVPNSVKLETYASVMEHGLREYEKGFKNGFNKGLEFAKGEK